MRSTNCIHLGNCMKGVCYYCDGLTLNMRIIWFHIHVMPPPKLSTEVRLHYKFIMYPL